MVNDYCSQVYLKDVMSNFFSYLSLLQLHISISSSMHLRYNQQVQILPIRVWYVSTRFSHYILGYLCSRYQKQNTSITSAFRCIFFRERFHKFCTVTAK